MDRKSATIVAICAATAMTLAILGLLFGEGTKGIYALGAIVNGVLLVVTVLGYQARRREVR